MDEAPDRNSSDDTPAYSERFVAMHGEDKVGGGSSLEQTVLLVWAAAKLRQLIEEKMGDVVVFQRIEYTNGTVSYQAVALLGEHDIYDLDMRDNMVKRNIPEP